jgi:uncharacterized membrane protein YjdF
MSPAKCCTIFDETDVLLATTIFQWSQVSPVSSQVWLKEFEEISGIQFSEPGSQERFIAKSL